MEENKAHFDIEEGTTEATQEVFKGDGEVVWLHGMSDNDKAEADVIITDQEGVTLHEMKDVKFGNKQFGEKINLPLTHDYCIIKLENIRNAKTIDVFVE